MLNLEFDDLVAVFRKCSRRAFHLETSDDYSGTDPAEAEGLQRFLAGETEDDSWMDYWFDLMGEMASNGVAVQRVRVISVPHSDYTRYSLATTQRSIDSGEDIRWLPRDLARELPSDDWWLFDDNLVAYTVFTDTGTLPGWMATTDPVIAAHCVSVRDRLWPKAIRHADYTRTGGDSR